MNENRSNAPEREIKVDLLISAENAREMARRDGYVLLNSRDLQELDIDLDVLAGELEKEGFKRQGGSKDIVLYDPSRFEVKSVDVYKGLDKKYTEEGWKEVSRSGDGDIAIIMKEK